MLSLMSSMSHRKNERISGVLLLRVRHKSSSAELWNQHKRLPTTWVRRQWLIKCPQGLVRLNRLKRLKEITYNLTAQSQVLNHMVTIRRVKYDGIYYGNIMLFFIASWWSFSTMKFTIFLAFTMVTPWYYVEYHIDSCNNSVP